MEEKNSGDARLAAICQTIRKETLEPAQQQAEAIIIAAEREASSIRAEAKQYADSLVTEARRSIEKAREELDIAMKQAAKQTIDVVKQKVENDLFSSAIQHLLEEDFIDNEKTASLLDLVLSCIQEQGISGDVEAWIGSKLSKYSILQRLSQQSLQSIHEDGLHISSMPYGLVVKVHSKHLSIEITPDSLRELMSSLIRSDFRKFFFQE